MTKRLLDVKCSLITGKAFKFIKIKFFFILLFNVYFLNETHGFLTTSFSYIQNRYRKQIGQILIKQN